MRRIRSKHIATLLILLSGLYFEFVNVSVSSKNQNSPGLEYLEKLPKNDYIIGEGDVIKITVSKKIPELTNNYSIDGSGTIFLPRLERVYISGLTIDELIDLLNKKYQDFVLEPKVEVEIVQYRPIRVYVDGEVEVPGMYTMTAYQPLSEVESKFKPYNQYNPISKPLIRGPGADFIPGVPPIVQPIPPNTPYPGSALIDKANINKSPKNTYFFPTVFDAIREAGGVTFYSDLSKVKITRVNNISNGGGRLETNLNFLSVINKGDQSQNIRIYDGDLIHIKKSSDPLPKQLNKAVRSNLNPRFINVFISGRVEQPGTYTVSKTSALTDAIALAGGAKFLKGPIRFIRFNLDGTIDTRRFGFRKNRSRGSYKNPYLKSGDIIYVGKSAINIAGEVLSEITAPFVGIYSTYGVYKNFSDIGK